MASPNYMDRLKVRRAALPLISPSISQAVPVFRVGEVGGAHFQRDGSDAAAAGAGHPERRRSH